MKLSSSLTVLITLLAASVAPVLRAQMTATLITACAAKLGGFARIVPDAAFCDLRLETVVRWNRQGPAGPQGVAGPSGPTGPAGPVGPQGPGALLPHVVLVPASGTPTANGSALVSAAAAIASLASATQPYVLQLDAGLYTLPGATGSFGLTLPGFISLKGEGITSTFVSAPASAGVQFLNGDGTGATFSVSDLTISSAGETIYGGNIANAVVDRVQANGYVVFASSTAAASLLITDSVITGPLQAISFVNTARYRIVGTQVYSFLNTYPAQGTLACFATYTPNLVAYPASCVVTGP